jgi:MFS family permease
MGLAERATVAAILVLFFLSGFAALLYQIIWQRIQAFFSGADVYCVTIIVSAFTAGMGLGSVVGGYLADRIPARWRIGLFAISELAIALFAFVSVWFRSAGEPSELHDINRDFFPREEFLVPDA